MVLVTYPRAPARITATTSSAASDTDRARNTASGHTARTASPDPNPAPRFPP